MQSATQLHAERLTGPQEAAVLYSANRVEAAIEELEACTRHHPASEPGPWLMLLDLYSVTDRRGAFELAADRYARTFRTTTTPPWGASAPVELAGTVALKGVLAKPDDLGDLYKNARERKIVAIDMGGVERIAYAYAGDFAMSLKALSASGKRVLLVNLAEIHATLLEIFGIQKHVVLMRRRGRVAEPQLLAA